LIKDQLVKLEAWILERMPDKKGYRVFVSPKSSRLFSKKYCLEVEKSLLGESRVVFYNVYGGYGSRARIADLSESQISNLCACLDYILNIENIIKQQQYTEQKIEEDKKRKINKCAKRIEEAIT
jgi:hypothetical protein